MVLHTNMVCKQHQIKGELCIMGNNGREYPDLAQNICNINEQIGCNSLPLMYPVVSLRIVFNHLSFFFTYISHSKAHKNQTFVANARLS